MRRAVVAIVLLGGLIATTGASTTARADGVGGALAAHATAAGATSQTRFAAASALELHGDYAGAAAALEQLGHERPDDEWAPDALFEAAVVCDERLGDPRRAQRLYDEVATRYPSHRLARRAKTRAEFLARSLTSGEGPLREYDAILVEPDAATARRRMEALLAAHPDFALTDRALYWLGTSYLQAHDETNGAARLTECASRFADGSWAGRCNKTRADLLLAQHKLTAARDLYRAMVTARDATTRSAGFEGLAALRTFWLRTAGGAAAALYLVVFLALSLRAARPWSRLRQLPLEGWYYAPVALLFVAAALTENALIGWATALIAVGGGLVTWLGAAATDARLERGPLTPAERGLRALTLLLAVMAVCLLAILTTGLTDLVIETFRAGPER